MKWPKDDFRRGFLYGVVFVLMIFVCLVLLFGCWSKHIIPAEPSAMTNAIIKTVKVNDWLVTGSILIMGVGVFGFFNGWKQGVSLIAAAGAVLGISLVLKAYGAILVFAGAICIAGFVSWQIWIRVRALKEVVGNVEEIKKMGPVYNENVVQIALQKQLPATKSIVAGIRKKINGNTK